MAISKGTSAVTVRMYLTRSLQTIITIYNYLYMLRSCVHIMRYDIDNHSYDNMNER